MISSFHFPAGESCEVLECQYHAKCFQITNGYAECRCPRCHPENGPAREAYVCGDNDKSYLTMCVLRLESCLLQTWIQKKHDGFCGKYYCILALNSSLRLFLIRVHLCGEGESLVEDLGEKVIFHISSKPAQVNSKVLTACQFRYPRLWEKESNNSTAKKGIRKNDPSIFEFLFIVCYFREFRIHPVISELFENDDVMIITWSPWPSFAQTKIQNGRWLSRF